MKLITNLSQLILASLRRLLAYKGTAFAALLGLTLALSLILSISIYSDAIYYQSFLENIAKTRENKENELSLKNPTFTFLFHYFGGWHGSKNWEELAELDAYFVKKGINSLGIRVVDLVRLFGSDNFHLFPANASGTGNRLSLSRISFGTMSGLEEHISLVDGRMPAPHPGGGQPVEVFVNENLAQRADIKTGEAYTAYVDVQTAAGRKESTEVPVEIVGIWRANDPGADYWIFSPSTYENILFVPEETFFNHLTAQIPSLVFNAYWYLIMDAEYVHADEVDSLLNRIARLERSVNEIQENLWLSISPKAALEQYAGEARILRVLLYAFSIPVIGLIVAFAGLVTRLSTDQRRGEIAVLRSRGGTRRLILGFTVLEGLIIGGLALGLSLPIATRITQSVGQTSGFLNFDNAAQLRVGLSTGAWQIGIFCVAAFIIMLLLPTFRAAQDTILNYKLERGRAALAPVWQRYWLDIMLLIPAAYGTYLLLEQGGLSIGDSENPADPFQNPLLFLVPSLGILALSLISLRLIGPVMALFDRIFSLTRRVSLTMAARNISRSPGNYFTPLLILTLTMSLFAYTASLAATLDQALIDRAYYQIGADARFYDPGASTVTRTQKPGSNTTTDENPVVASDSASATTSNRTSNITKWWDFFPVAEYTQSPGIAHAARLGRYAADAAVGRIAAEGIFFGIDRLNFPLAAYWRDDFSAHSLGELMNLLAADPTNLLVSRDFLTAGGLKIGDYVEMTVKTYDRSTDLNLKIVGAFDLFPSWYPDQGPLFVGNLDHLFEAAGGPVPYYVLIKAEEGAGLPQLDADQLRALDGRVRPVDWDMPASHITAAQSAPERQGFLGFLFLGFATAALLTVLAFLLHLIFTFQGRSVELSVLRAAGLSMPQMIANLVWEFAFLMLLGGGIGTALGYLASKVYIPYMQIGTAATELIPPFQVLIPWGTITQIYWLFLGLFGISLLISSLLLRRMKIFQAIKLGETV